MQRIRKQNNSGSLRCCFVFFLDFHNFLCRCGDNFQSVIAHKDLLEQIVCALGLQDKLHNLPNNLSGGQQQRVSIARALLTKPEIILADEPTGNLDSKTSEDVLFLLKSTGIRFHQTIVMITHNDAIAKTADRIIRIEDGRIKQ